MHDHQKTHNKIVRNILRLIAHKHHQPYPNIKKKFTFSNDREITMEFWDLLRKAFPEHSFTEVSHCPECKKFSLE